MTETVKAVTRATDDFEAVTRINHNAPSGTIDNPIQLDDETVAPPSPLLTIPVIALVNDNAVESVIVAPSLPVPSSNQQDPAKIDSATSTHSNNSSSKSSSCSPKRPECPICFIEFRRTTQKSTLSCRHVFHTKCIDKWIQLSAHHDCPVCRTRY